MDWLVTGVRMLVKGGSRLAAMGMPGRGRAPCDCAATEWAATCERTARVQLNVGSSLIERRRGASARTAQLQKAAGHGWHRENARGAETEFPHRAAGTGMNQMRSERLGS